MTLKNIPYSSPWFWAIVFLLLWGVYAWGFHIYSAEKKHQALTAMRDQAVTGTRKSVEQAVVPPEFENGFRASAQFARQYNNEFLLWENQDARNKIKEAVKMVNEINGISFVSVTDSHGKILVHSDNNASTDLPPETAGPQPEPITKQYEIDGTPVKMTVSVSGRDNTIYIVCRSESTYSGKTVGYVIVGMTIQLFLPEEPHTFSFYLWTLILPPLLLSLIFLIVHFLVMPKLRHSSPIVTHEPDDKPDASSSPEPESKSDSDLEFIPPKQETPPPGEENTNEKEDTTQQAVPNLLYLDPEDSIDGRNEILGPYLLIKKLATGGMAELFVADHVGDDGFRRQVVVKRILPHLVNNTQFVKRFIEEARLAAFLQHPNVVQITDFGKIDKAYFIVMEYVRGKNLAQIMEKSEGRLELNQVIYIISQICRGLHYSHTKNIIHRDISPQNILISFQGEVKISDFGIARMGAGTGLTTGIIGKLNYLSPEQALGKSDEVDQQSDIFSLGILFYEMLTGKNLYKSKNEIEILRAIPEKEVKPVKEINKDIPDNLNLIVMKCLEKDKSERYHTVRELMDDMASLRHQINMIYDNADLSAFITRLFVNDSF